jgi:putative DNA primase/helicase
VITEGEKKAMKAVQEGIACVAVQGVWSWADPSSRAEEKVSGRNTSADTRPLEALLTTANKYKEVLVLGDSDLAGKPQARAGFEALVRSLRKLKIRAYFNVCPPSKGKEADGTGVSDVGKQGLDDWLAAEGPSFVRKSLELLSFAAQVLYERPSEAYSAEGFAQYAEGRLVHSPGMGWMAWNNVHWEADQGNVSVRRLVNDFAGEVRARAESMDEWANRVARLWPHRHVDDLPEPVRNWVNPIKSAAKDLKKVFDALRSTRGINNTITLAESYISIGADVWDRDPLILGVRNGIVDLKTGKLLKPDPKLYLSRCAGVEYAPEAKCPVWMTFLERVQPDAHAREALQALAGYSATGHTGTQAAFFHYGTGSTVRAPTSSRSLAL